MAYSNYQLSNRINNLQRQINNLGPIGEETLNDVLTNGNESTLSIELSEPTSVQTLLLDGTIAKIEQLSLGVNRNANMNSIGFNTIDKITGYNTTLSNTTLLFGGGDYQTYITHTDTSLNITNDNEMNIEAPTVNMNGQVNFDTPPHSVSPILGNDLTIKSYVDTLIGNYGGNGLPLYFNIASANPNPITVYPINEELSQTLIAVDATPSANYYTLQSTALGTDTLIASFTTPIGYPNIFTIPAGLWNMLIYGYASGSGGQLYYHFHLLELKSDSTTALIATSGFSSDVNATSSTDPDTYHASLSIVEPYVLDSIYSRLIIEIYSTGTGMGGSVKLNTLFGGPYYSFISTSLSGGTSILNMNNNWSGDNTYQQMSYFLNGIRGTIVETTSIDAVSSITSLTIGNIGSTLILKGGSGNSITVDSNTNMTVKDQTALSNNSNVANTKYVDTAISALSSVYQTISGMSAYLTTATASTTYQTISGMSAYLTTATASATYATISSLSSYLTTATASTTYQTISGMSSYLTTTNASTIYGAKAIANTWALLQTFTLGITTGTITSPAIGSSIAIGDNQTTGAMTIGTGATRSGSIGIGANSCAVNVGGILNAQQGVVLSAGKFITYTTHPASVAPAINQLGYITPSANGLTAIGTFAANDGCTNASQGLTIGTGTWLVSGQTSITTTTTTARIIYRLSDTSNPNGTLSFLGTSYGVPGILQLSASTATTQSLAFNLPIQNTTGGNITLYLVASASYSSTGPTIPIAQTLFAFRATKLA